MTSPERLIEVEGLSKSYGRVRALDSISFHVNEGEIVGFLGPNGAGKTTTLRVLAGFLPGDVGRVRVCGYDIARESVRVREVVGYLPEGVPLYPDMRVIEYLQFRARLKRVPRWRRGEAYDVALRATGTEGVRKRIIGTLSRGYRQRVGLADALLGDPRVLILDEPTVGLDPEQVRQFRELVRRISRRRTVILSTHILSEVELICTKVLIINHGRIEVSDSAETLRLAGATRHRVVTEITGPPAAVTRALEALTGAESVACEETGGAEAGAKGGYGLYTIVASDDRDLRAAVFRLVRDRGWELRRLEVVSEEPSLEDAFLRIVEGRRK